MSTEEEEKSAIQQFLDTYAWSAYRSSILAHRYEMVELLVKHSYTHIVEEITYLSLSDVRQLSPVICKLPDLRMLRLRLLPDFERPPDWFSALPNLKHLILEAHKLIIVPVEINKLRHLETLKLDRIMPRILEIGNLVNLKQLKLIGNGLTKLPAGIGQLQHLVKLSLNYNKFTNLPGELFTLTSLKTLEVASNQLTALPESIGALTGLEKLQLTSNQLASLPSSIAALSQLQELKLCCNQLVVLPENIGDLQRFQQLDISNNRITALPDSFARLRQLQKLDLRGNPLAASEVKKLRKWLPDTDILENHLEFIPEAKTVIDELNQLLKGDAGQIEQAFERLQSGRIAYEMMPYIFNTDEKIWLALEKNFTAGLQHVKKLFLKAHHITAVPACIGRLKNLEELWLHENSISSLPETLGDLKNLETLYLSKNQLTRLPESFCHLVNLMSLNLSENQFTDVPESLCNLVNLTSLDLGENRLVVLPPGFHRLKKLEFLRLANNQFNTFPAEICELENLSDLSIRNNPFTSVPPEIVKLQRLSQMTLSVPFEGLPETFKALPNLSSMRFPLTEEEKKKLRAWFPGITFWLS